MAPGGENPHRSDNDHNQQRTDEKVGGNEEGGAGVLYPPHVDEGENEEDGKAERERVGLKRGKGGNQSSHPSRDADRRVEDVVDHQRRSG